MDTEFLIAQGNQHRSERRYQDALQCYALAFAKDPDSSAAFNNYGNVMREIGYPRRAIPFLQHAIELDPTSITAKFNLAVTYLISGDYSRGWPAYEARWNYEHLDGSLPKHSQPRWTGQDLKNKTILVVGEQGHGDNIQFVRFLWNLHVMGARIKLQVTAGLVPLLETSNIIDRVDVYGQDMGEFDYWVPIMSIPGVLGITLQNLPRPTQYLNAPKNLELEWLKRLGPKTKLRVGFSWSGRRDAWLNQHKGMPFELMLNMVQQHPEYEWTNLQIDSTEEETEALAQAGAKLYPGSITGFHDTAALIACQDVVLSVDTAIAHLSGALGRPTWVMLQKFGQDWRWLLDRDDSPWYASARLFRQPDFDDWPSVLRKVEQYLSWFKV